MKAIHFKRLLNVARALRESPEPKAFDMRTFVHGDGALPNDMEEWCGTPACALGHYGARRDLQREFEIVWGGGYDGKEPRLTDSEGHTSCLITWASTRHFGLTRDESLELFDTHGCGGAKTAKQAARYIERFVARKQREQKAARS